MGATLVTPFALAGAALSAGVNGVTQEVQARWQNHRAQKAQRYQDEAASSLTQFTQRCKTLTDDPTVKPLLATLDKAAQAKPFNGDRAALYDAMITAGDDHKLTQQVKSLLQNHPHLETCYAQVHAAFDRVLDTWGRCSRANAAVGQRWLPSDEQITAFKQAAATIPPDGRREHALIRHAEAAIKHLVEMLQRLFQHRRPAASTHHAPAPGG